MPELIFDDDESDVVVIKVWPHGIPVPAGLPIPVAEGSFATKEMLGTIIPGEQLAMIGYPSGAPKVKQTGVFDEVPAIYRAGVLASLIEKPIEVPNALGYDYGLMDSFAKSGFSGAPIYVLPRSEIAMEGGAKFPAQEGLLIGLVAGHYRSHDDNSDGRHAGLSYFTLSSRILATLRRAATI
jgi:hypothetical protein